MDIKVIQQQDDFKPIDLVISIKTKREFQLIKQFFGNLSYSEVAKIANESTIEDSINDFTATEYVVDEFGCIYDELDNLII